MFIPPLTLSVHDVYAGIFLISSSPLSFRCVYVCATIFLNIFLVGPEKNTGKEYARGFTQSSYLDVMEYGNFAKAVKHT